MPKAVIIKNLEPLQTSWRKREGGGDAAEGDSWQAIGHLTTEASATRDGMCPLIRTKSDERTTKTWHVKGRKKTSLLAHPDEE